MRNYLLGLLIGASLSVGACNPVAAQQDFGNSTGYNITNCGSPPVAFNPSTPTQARTAPFTVDQNGVQCATLGNGYPSGATPVTASATGTTSAAATLPAAAGKTTFLCGLHATMTGATAAGAGTLQVTGTISDSLNWVVSQVAITANNQAPLDISFSPCVPGSAVNTGITGTLTLGAGTTNDAVTLTGFQF